MHSVSRCASRPTSVRVWRQKPVICSLQALEIIISLGVTRAMHRQQGNPMPSCKYRICIQHFCVYFAFCSLFYSHSIHCVAHFRFIFASFCFLSSDTIEMYSRKIRVDFVAVVVVGSFHFTDLPSALHILEHLNAFSIELEWKPNWNFAAMQIQRRLCPGGHFIAQNKCADCLEAIVSGRGSER